MIDECYLSIFIKCKKTREREREKKFENTPEIPFSNFANFSSLHAPLKNVCGKCGNAKRNSFAVSQFRSECEKVENVSCPFD